MPELQRPGRSAGARRRRRRSLRRAPSRRASPRSRHLHLRYAGTEAALIVRAARSTRDRRRLHRGASRALRLRHAGPAAGGRGGRGRGDRARRGGAGSDAAARAASGAPAADRHGARCSPAARTHAAPVFDRTDLLAGDRIAGPALIREANATTVVEPGWTAEVTRARPHDCCAAPSRCATRVAAGSDRPDPVLLELFNNLFMNVAEQTGAVLQNTSMSVNIKERLDFSCAIFDARGLPGRQRAACAGASRRDGRERAHRAAQPRRHAEAGRRRGAEQPVQRRHASAGRHRHHPGVRRRRARTSCSSSAAAAITPISAASRRAPRRRCRARWRRKAW